MSSTSELLGWSSLAERRSGVNLAEYEPLHWELALHQECG